MQPLFSTTLRRFGAAPWLRTIAMPCSNSVATSALLPLSRFGAVSVSPSSLTSTTTTITAITIRSKHSKTQIKRLFKNNPARKRVHERKGILPKMHPPPEAPTFAPVVEPVEILPNGWTPPPKVPVPEYPFAVARTKNKPKDAVGFLPVYSRMRKDGTLTKTRIKKVSGDRNLFIQELRAVLQIPTPAVAADDAIRVRTGGTIEVKGNHVRTVRTWLAGLGF